MGHVVEFPVRLPEAEVFAHADMARLYAAWRQAARARGLPRLRDFAPRLLGRWMAWSGIAETDAGTVEALYDGAVFRWRLAGSALCRLAGEELTRQVAFADWQQFERATLTRLLGQAVFRGQAFVARLKLNGGDISDAGVELVILPMRDTARGRDVALLVFRPDFPPESLMPSRLAEARLMSLRTLLGVDAAGQTALATPAMSAAVAKILPLRDTHPAGA